MLNEREESLFQLFRTTLFALALLLAFPVMALCEQPGIILGKKSLTVGEDFTISLIFSQENKKEFLAYKTYRFPDIPDFIKGRTVYLSENTDGTYKIIQYYSPRKSGNFVIPALKIPLRDKVLHSEETTIKVEGAAKPITFKPDPSLEYEPEPTDAFLVLKPSKSSVYEGEAFKIALLFCIANDNKSELTFIDLYEQKLNILKKSTPANCWTQTLSSPEELTVDTMSINGKVYNCFLLHELLCHSIDSLKISFPSMDFKVMTYSKAETSISIERKPEVTTYSSEPVIIDVVALPPHPFRNSAPVGNFTFTESLNKKETTTGEAFTYKFTIIGDGNATIIDKPFVRESSNLDIHSPRVNESRNKDKSVSKTFTFNIVAKEPGRFNLNDYFYWIFFNLDKKQYDTLRPSKVIIVEGESLKNTYIASNSDPFYNKIIDKVPNKLQPKQKDQTLKFFANLIILLMLVTTAILIFKR
ncbi:MAG TPA: BatD family protein [Cytophagaceae bacterium]